MMSSLLPLVEQHSSPADGKIGLSAARLEQIFPFYIGCNEELAVTQFGAKVRSAVPALQLGQPLTAALRVLRPSHIPNADAVRRRQNNLFLFEAAGGLRLRGQAMWLEEESRFLFLVSPWFADPAEARRYGISLDDLPVHDAAREFAHIARLQRETVAEVNHAYLELQAQKREAEAMRDAALEANRAKSAFLAMMSHEIRTPLNGVIGMLDYVLGGSLEDTQFLCLQTAQESALGLLAVLNDILDLSKLEAGRMELASAPFSAARVVESVRAIFEPQAMEKGIALAVDTPPAGAPLRLGDEQRVRQILVNLVSNAIKFTAVGEVRIALHADGAGLQLRVTDTGPGIPPEAAARLFQPFQQIGLQRNGTGLGLSICRRLAELMGGSIRHHSPEAGGSCFAVELPLPEVADVAAAPAPLRQAIAAGSGQGRVLVVEDGVVNQRVAQLLLGRLGYDVECAANGALGVASAEREAFDLIFMDMQMPVMDGLEATRRIRAAGLNQTTPIIALTANAFAADREACLVAGMDAFLPKPLQSPALLDAIGQASKRAAFPDAP